MSSSSSSSSSSSIVCPREKKHKTQEAMDKDHGKKQKRNDIVEPSPFNNHPFAGTVPCQQTCNAGKQTQSPCTEKARYVVFRNDHQQYVCGHHAKCSKTKLPVMSEDQARAYRDLQNAAFDALAKNQADENKTAGKRGTVILHRMRMMHNVERLAGYTDVYPNFRHYNPSGGIGMSGLSPKSPWLVEHGQPGLPPAQNIENFWQFSKRYSWETKESFEKHREWGYRAETPHRHKTPETVRLCMEELGEYASFEERLRLSHSNHTSFVCEAFVWRDQEGKEHDLGVVEARTHYCSLYERYVKTRPEFHTLQEMLKNGGNIRLCGYDAHPITKETYLHEYNSSVHPFGHERQLWVMLSIDESLWPWKLTEQ